MFGVFDFEMTDNSNLKHKISLTDKTDHKSLLRSVLIIRSVLRELRETYPSRENKGADQIKKAQKLYYPCRQNKSDKLICALDFT